LNGGLGRGVAAALTITVLLGALACAPAIHSIAPLGLEPVAPDTIAAWLQAYQPATRVRYDLRWRFITQKGSTAGRAAVRIAPPDSARFDYRGPFGKSGAAMILGDSAPWAVPEKDTRDLLPAAPLFWAALGAPRPPARDAALYARWRTGSRAWRYAAERDTMDFVETGSGPEGLLTEVRRGGKIVASAEVRFQAGSRVPVEARLRFPQDGSALLLTVQGVEKVADFDPIIWRRP
jgi:hypothetical protein